MSKKTNFSKLTKRFLAILSVCLIGLSLTACNSANRKATGDLDLNEPYAQAGDFKVTVGDVYDSLRYNANSFLEAQMNQAVYKKEIETVKADVDKYQEKFEETILKDIYGTDDEEEIKDLSDSKKADAIAKYIDKMYKAGYVISKSDIEENKFKEIYSYYYLDVAKFVAAENKLKEEFTVKEDGTIDFGKIDDDSYFSTKEVVKWYDDNYTNVKDVQSVIIRFVSSTEASNLLRAFGIKTYDGAWYQIKLNVNNEADYDTKNKYDDYYKDYVVDPVNKSDSSIEISALGKATILKIFVAIYNYIYTFRNPIELQGDCGFKALDAYRKDYTGPKHLVLYNYVKDEIIDKDASKREGVLSEELEKLLNDEYKAVVDSLIEHDKTHEDSTFIQTKEELEKYSSSFATYLYETLDTEKPEDEDTFNQYSTSAKSYGDFYFLAFKVNQEEDVKLYEEKENKDGDIEYTFLDTKEAKDLLQTILNEMFEEELTTDYINKEYERRCKKSKVVIYDSIVELQFMQATNNFAKNYEKSKKKSNTNVASIKYGKETTKITVADLWNNLEPMYGSKDALSLLFDQYLKTTHYYKDLEKDYDNYRETLELMLNYFANDFYAQYGYPSTIGKYNFMLLYYHTADIDDAIKDSLMLSDARNAFYADITEKYATTEGSNKFFDTLATLSANEYNNYYSLTATGITAYVDRNEDGKADKEVDDDTKALMQQLLLDAVEFIKTNDQAYATSVSKLLADYKASSRILDVNNPTAKEQRWAKYRKEGIYLSSKEIGEVTNASKEIEANVQNRLKELYAEIEVLDEGFITAVVDNQVLETKDGYTVLLVTAGKQPTTAKYEPKDGEELLDTYKRIPVIVNDKTEYVDFTQEDYNSNLLSAKQIKVYVLNTLLLGEINNFPATTKAALDAYVKPLLNRYTGEASQLLLMRNALTGLTFSYNKDLAYGNDAFKNANKERSTILNNYIEIAKRTADEYNSEKYAQWWELYTNKEANI